MRMLQLSLIWIRHQHLMEKLSKKHHLLLMLMLEVKMIIIMNRLGSFCRMLFDIVLIADSQ